MDIPKIVLNVAENKGFDRMAAYVCEIDGFKIYSLGVEDRKHWFPCPPDAPVLVSFKNGKVSDYDDFWAVYDLMNCEEN